MGSMSASDAAPLPRLGEVFFDVRGSSRSMRLSWYANTGIAVFSIWQGGTCTGTFRLAIGPAPAEPFTGAMSAVTDEQIAAYAAAARQAAAAAQPGAGQRAAGGP